MEPPKALPWYPGKLAWQFNFSRQQLRKLADLEAIHEFVKRENDAGTITRQEAVSMVPPLFLDVQPNHKVRPIRRAARGDPVMLMYIDGGSRRAGGG